MLFRSTPAVLATRKDLERLVQKQNDVPLLAGWRYELVGADLMNFLQGAKTVHIHRDSINID